jgi:hypothetical protein
VQSEVRHNLRWNSDRIMRRAVINDKRIYHFSMVNGHLSLPPGMAGKRYSGKFNLRLGRHLNERLAIEATKEGKSLNAYVAEVLEHQISRNRML